MMMNDSEEGAAVDNHMAVDEEQTQPLSVRNEYQFANRILPDLGYDVEDSQTFLWEIQSWRELGKRVNSPAFEVGGHNWKILLFPQGNNQSEQISVYLEYADTKEAPEGWHVCAQFALVISNPSDPTVYEYHTAQHRFVAEESDWGFTRFTEAKRLGVATEQRGKPLVEDDQTVITAFVRIIKDETGVLWHNFINYDSKKETGHVGLKNQGATCYMNSLLQSLYFTNYFRKAVYEIPTEQDEPTKSIALALQRLFYNLQFNDLSVGTTELTRSFGWDSLDAFMQHDVQEFNRVLQDNLEVKMKNTPADGATKRLFEGKMKSYIKCINVDYESSRVEDFYDIQLNVKGCKNVEESFKEYIAEETLEGDNSYMAEGYGLQDAKKGVIFESFPPVLHLQLKRYEYDIERDAMVKNNDRYEFPTEIDLEPYLEPANRTGQGEKYILHGVLVHSGDFHGGHYFALLKPEKDGKWYKFDDDRVTLATLKEVTEENFGGEPPNAMGAVRPNMKVLKRFTNAYMLVYIRESAIDEVLAPVTIDDIPDHLKRRLDEEKSLQEQRRKQQKEMHLFMNVKIITDDTFRAHRGFDLFSNEEKPSGTPSDGSIFRVKRQDTYRSFLDSVYQQFNIPPEQMRMWVMVNRQNKTIRPDQPISPTFLDRTMEELRLKLQANQSTLRFYLEISSERFKGTDFWFPPDGESHLLVFIKFYDPAQQLLTGVGHVYVHRDAKVGDIAPTLCEMVNLPSDIPIRLYEEIKPSMIDQMKPNMTFHQSEIQDGDIICFQKAASPSEAEKLPSDQSYATAPEYYDYLQNRIFVTFKPKFDKAAEEFELVLSRKDNYDAVATKVAKHLNADPNNIRFTTANSTNGSPKSVLKRSVYQILADMVQPLYGASLMNLLYYEVLQFSVAEMETKKAVKVNWLGNGLQPDTIIELLVPKISNIGDLCETLKAKHVKLDPAGTNEIRVYEAVGNKIDREFASHESVSSINSTYATLYAEQVPLEETEMRDGDKLVQVYHFYKEPARAHSVPFRFVVKQGEPFADTRKRLQQRAGIKDKDWPKVKIAIVPAGSFPTAEYIEDDNADLSTMNIGPDDLLGLDHIDKSGKSRGGLFERAIFIRG
ncbi:hypothetical protein BZG36_01825 [Bifiguratus adelaidae]|uniref:ubiquitinyl hydrolase 1 n=1 Tax=Bifiguratus adelaidae TaxID=1938954 RepID=A0A261Y2C8_9FUNG|nr:hypothetical protein BZG36_01825 [Bifiguratus adelaidae]